MILNNIEGFSSMHAYIENKVSKYSNDNYRSFGTMFSYMFSEENNVFSEQSDGYRIKKTSYGECKNAIYSLAVTVSHALKDIPSGSRIGLCAANSLRWIQSFWAILMCGYNPVLFNPRLPLSTLEGVIAEHNVAAVISDGAHFSSKTLDLGDLFTENTTEQYSPTAWGEEIIFMSSGTTGNVKLCAYTSENLFYQILNSVSIISACPQIIEHYEGELKLLALLPLYHVFGFLAVYVWFSFFSRTLVFLKDLNPQTVQNTVKKHKVTHFFAVPMVWEGVYKKTVQAIRNKGEKTYNKFQKALKTSASDGFMRKRIIKSAAFTEIREQLFGDSLRFLISGGSAVSQEVLEFFNGIGYCMVNGFGMTEAGITSVETSAKSKVRCGGSIGYPFNHVEYSVSESGELLIRGKAMASTIISSEKCLKTDFNEWFNTHDLIKKQGERYYHQGRKDDLVVCSNGENINPELLEGKLLSDGVNDVCLFSSKGSPVLIASIEKCFSAKRLQEVRDGLIARLKENNLQDEIKKLVLTTDRLIEDGQIKISRKKVAERYEQGDFKALDLTDAEGVVTENLTALEREICECFAIVLERPIAEINAEGDFFTDLGGTSLDYFALLDDIKAKYGVDASSLNEEKLFTVKNLCEYIKENS